MNSRKYLIDLCIIPFLCILPLFGLTACTSEEVTNATALGAETVGNSIADFPDNIRIATPYLQEDLETLWYTVSGSFEVAADTVGVGEPPHALTQARRVREKLISGATLEEVIAHAASRLTPEDLENMPISDLGALNGVLPFDINLESCGESLAEVLNSLDIGQVSAVLKSEVGYHIVQLIDRHGGSVRLGHVVFEVEPGTQVAEQNDVEAVPEVPEPLRDAISRLARAIEDQ